MSFFDADYSAIEARIVCWLAGQEAALEEYRQGVDRYKRMASVIYGIPEGEVNKFPQRFVGKSAILGAGFGLGPTKFRITCKDVGKYDLPEGMEFTAIESWRKEHPLVVKYWSDIDKAAKRAITKQGTHIHVRNVSFMVKNLAGIPYLLLRLPSGRELSYPWPKIKPGRFENSTAIGFYGNIKGTTWGTVDTYGGKLVENITQAVAADIMAHGAHNAENAGYQIATLIHDQALAYVRPNQTSDEFVRLLTDLPSWAAGLPIEAEGGMVNFYKKD